jgi:hypothetical protein
MLGRLYRPEQKVSGNIRNISYESSYITVKYAAGNVLRIPIASVLTESDIPDLTENKVEGLTVLARLLMALLRTLLLLGVLDEGIADDNYDLDTFIEELEGLGAEL